MSGVESLIEGVVAAYTVTYLGHVCTVEKAGLHSSAPYGRRHCALRVLRYATPKPN